MEVSGKQVPENHAGPVRQWEPLLGTEQVVGGNLTGLRDGQAVEGAALAGAGGAAGE